MGNKNASAPPQVLLPVSGSTQFDALQFPPVPTFTHFHVQDFLQWAQTHPIQAFLVAVSSTEHMNYCCAVIRDHSARCIPIRCMEASSASLATAWEQARRDVRSTTSAQVISQRGSRGGLRLRPGSRPTTFAVFGWCSFCARVLLDAGFNANTLDHHGRTALHEASSADYTDNITNVQLLLRAGADPNKRGSARVVPLLAAAAAGESIRIVDALLRAGADPTLTWDVSDKGPPVTAAEVSHRFCSVTSIPALLTQKAAEHVLEALLRDTHSYFSLLRLPGDEDGTRNTIVGALALFCAWEQARPAHQAGVLCEDRVGRSAGEFELLSLLHGAIHGEKECTRVAALLRLKVGTRTMFDSYGVLHCNDCLEVFKLCLRCSMALVEAGFPLNTRDYLGQTPLIASLSGVCDTSDNALYLIAQGAWVNMPDCRGNVPIAHATMNGKLPAVRALVAAGARLDWVVHVSCNDGGKKDCSLLEIAVNARKPRTAAFLEYAMARALLEAHRARDTCYLSVLPERALIDLVAQCLCGRPCLEDLSGETDEMPPMHGRATIHSRRGAPASDMQMVCPQQ